MRITQLQFERLDGARTRDGMSMQEHIRRALDYYLEKLDREAQRQNAIQVPPGYPAQAGPGGDVSSLPSAAREPDIDDKARLVDHGEPPPYSGISTAPVAARPSLRSR